jgi:hypothetical protein
MRSWIVSAGLALWAGAGCDLSELGEAPPAPCRESGAQCQLSDGPLGVCERTACGADAAPPCFTCTSQH